MGSLKTKDIRTNLKKKGFEEDDSRDHIWLNYRTPDGRKTTVRTKLSHGKADIGEPLIGNMARQTHLTKEEFIRLVSCTLSGEEYFSKVKGIL